MTFVTALRKCLNGSMRRASVVRKRERTAWNLALNWNSALNLSSTHNATALHGFLAPRARAPLAALSALIIGALLLPAPAAAQFTYNPRPPVVKKQGAVIDNTNKDGKASKDGSGKNSARPAPVAPKDDGQMLVQADEINYDYTNSRVAAAGRVQIYYNGATVEADRVIYDQKTKRLRAEGNVRLAEPDGKITHSSSMELSDDYRDGFVDSLRLETADRTHMAATRADRSNGNFTVFKNGVYTACEPCKDNPKKPPLWQVKAARIIHDQGEKMLYFETAQIEFFGKPLAYLPYFSTPDPTVKRKSGWLMPLITTSSKYGVGVETPYYWALAPNYDLTLSPRVMSKQGVLGQAEFRHRLMEGSYEIRASGLIQADKGFFDRGNGTSTPGNRQNRGALESSGQFALNQNWVWGWDAVLLSDKTFFQDYGLSAFKKPVSVFQFGATEGISQLYLQGAHNRSFFDLRTIHYFGYSEADRQAEIPVVHPVMDYSYKFDRPIMGGELGYKFNFVSLSRQSASFDPISATAMANGLCAPTSANPAAKTPANCLLRGIPGAYTRFSGEVEWRKAMIDTYGQVWTPFLSLRGDIANASVGSDPGVTNYIAAGNTQIGRVMPTAGLEYRYPFISSQSWGTQTLTPIAQVIVRPNEQRRAALPNEDAQSLTFDDTNLFRVDKFSGWDRAEGGGRMNVGIESTTQFDRGGTINVLFGQSYQLFGQNSFATGDLTNTGTDSGLETRRSDYVGRLSYLPNRILAFSTRARLDENDFTLKRLEIEARANFDRWSVGVLYGQYAEQPSLGFLTRREGVLGSASWKIASNWVVTGGALYDLDAHKVAATMFGAGYVDDCFIMGVNYVTNYTYSGNPVTDHRVTLQIGLRTIGNSSLSQSVSGVQNIGSKLSSGY